MTSKLFQSFARFKTVSPNCCVKRRAEDLTVVFGELQGSDSFGVGLLEPSQTLPCGNFPDSNLAAFRTRSQHLTVPGKSQTQYCLFHHHKVVLCLVLEILTDLASGKVPDLKKAVHRSGDKVLAVRRKGSTFDVRFGSELDLFAKSCRVFFFLFLSHCSLATEQIDLGTRGKEPLMLLPFQSLAKK